MAGITKSLVSGKGETFTLNVEHQNPDGSPVDLTGYGADFELVKRGTGTSIGTYEGTVDDEGHIAIKVADEETALWPEGQHAYRLVLNYPNGDKRWLMTGRFTVKSGDE